MKQNYREKAVAFHGHECRGLETGVRVCEAVMERFNIGLSSSPDDELVCIAESDSCAVDAVQALLSCTAGKGNLFIDNKGKHVFTFFKRESGQALRFYAAGENIVCKEVQIPLPERARIHASVICSVCGEFAAENKIHTKEGKKLCADCC
jgi:formylmethanofuran dehydrogenase subunit E